jgi:hypothetical protein
VDQAQEVVLVLAAEQALDLDQGLAVGILHLEACHTKCSIVIVVKTSLYILMISRNQQESHCR